MTIVMRNFLENFLAGIKKEKPLIKDDSLIVKACIKGCIIDQKNLLYSYVETSEKCSFSKVSTCCSCILLHNGRLHNTLLIVTR